MPINKKKYQSHSLALEMLRIKDFWDMEWLVGRTPKDIC